jgi:hypothetical protein
MRLARLQVVPHELHEIVVVAPSVRWVEFAEAVRMCLEHRETIAQNFNQLLGDGGAEFLGPPQRLVDAGVTTREELVRVTRD